MKHDLDWI